MEPSRSTVIYILQANGLIFGDCSLLPRMHVPFPWTKTLRSNSRKKLHSLPLFSHSKVLFHFLKYLLMRRAGYLPPECSLSLLAMLPSSSCCVGQLRSAETTAVLPASSHQAGRASLCSINYAIALSCYSYSVTLRSTLTVFTYVAL